MSETPFERAARVGHCDVHWHWHDRADGFRTTSGTCRCDCEEEILPKDVQIVQDDLVYLVFSGTPTVFTKGDAIIGSTDAYGAAERHAAMLAEETHQPYTIMMVPRSSVDVAVVATYEGVVIKSLPEVTSE
jgi:hypothetical protein